MTPTPNLHDLTGAAEIPPALLERTETDLTSFLEGARPIVEAVRREGDAALQRFARDFDKVEAKEMSLRATEEEFERAFQEIDPAVHRAIDYAIGNIRRFHEAQKPEEMWLKEVRPGAFAGDRIRAIDSVACYVPRGKGSFPSVLMMTTIPAKVAGVPGSMTVESRRLAATTQGLPGPTIFRQRGTVSVP